MIIYRGRDKELVFRARGKGTLDELSASYRFLEVHSFCDFLSSGLARISVKVSRRIDCIERIR